MNEQTYSRVFGALDNDGAENFEDIRDLQSGINYLTATHGYSESEAIVELVGDKLIDAFNILTDDKISKSKLRTYVRNILDYWDIKNDLVGSGLVGDIVTAGKVQKAWCEIIQEDSELEDAITEAEMLTEAEQIYWSVFRADEAKEGLHPRIRKLYVDRYDASKAAKSLSPSKTIKFIAAKFKGDPSDYEIQEQSDDSKRNSSDNDEKRAIMNDSSLVERVKNLFNNKTTTEIKEVLSGEKNMSSFYRNWRPHSYIHLDAIAQELLEAFPEELGSSEYDNKNFLIRGITKALKPILNDYFDVDEYTREQLNGKRITTTFYAPKSASEHEIAKHRASKAEELFANVDTFDGQMAALKYFIPDGFIKRYGNKYNNEIFSWGTDDKVFGGKYPCIKMTYRVMEHFKKTEQHDRAVIFFRNVGQTTTVMDRYRPSGLQDSDIYAQKLFDAIKEKFNGITQIEDVSSTAIDPVVLDFTVAVPELKGSEYELEETFKRVYRKNAGYRAG
jgi:hypothetical protein